MDQSGDKPLKEALVIMNNEGVSSLAVIDNQYNVVGNISNTDVKVLYQAKNLFNPCQMLTDAAPDKVKLSTSTRKHLHTLHLCHPFHPWHERWQRFLPSVSRIPSFDTRAYSRQAGRYKSPQVFILPLRPTARSAPY